MAKTATTPAMEYSSRFMDFYVDEECWCCRYRLDELFDLPIFANGEFIRLSGSTTKTPSSRRIRFQCINQPLWSAEKSQRPEFLLWVGLQNWLLEHFPKWTDRRVHALYVQVLPGKRGGKPYPVRKD